MSDLKTQRNVAIGVAALAVAFVAGYLISNRSGSAPASPLPTVEAAASAAAEPAPPAAAQVVATPAAAPAPTTPVVGQRSRQTQASRPVSGEAVPVEARQEPAAVAANPSAPARRVERVTIPASTPIVLALVGPVSSQTAQVGDEVVAELDEPLRVGGEIVVPAGTRVTGRVSEAQALRKVGGKAILGLAFDRLESGDGGAEIVAAFRREGRSETGKDAATIAAGAAIGTILGNQAKSNDRGKVIGAVVGAAAGTAVAAKTEGERVELAAGARLELTLRTDVEVVVDR
ncbi:MAG: hypothetical protein NDJ75_03485 [Thermoanaerobaculia bacterium]|nr:hypothetical protein [Thermoanaerobaculia bacterium]